MGMAASQARLLSIKSRMADNELRSQIINNSKMRLATESSKVSEEYISALNSATMMMSNYDIAGESQYQKLSFNSLTAYSSYNNQYGLVNANGNLLVSEADAVNFRTIKENNGDIDDFLALYGLEYTSTYFTADTLGGDPIDVVYIDEDDNESSLGQYSVAQLKDMYEGTNGYDKTYDDCFQTSEYVNYSESYEDMLIADENYKIAVSSEVSKNIFDSTWEANFNKYVQLSSGDLSSMQEAYKGFEYIRNKIINLQNSNKLGKDNEWANKLLETINTVKFTSNGSSAYLEAESKVVDNGDGTYTIDDSILLNTKYKNEDGDIVYHLEKLNPTSGLTYEFSPNDFTPPLNGSINFTYSEIETIKNDETGEDESSVTNYNFSYVVGEETAHATYTYQSPLELQVLLSNILTEFQAEIANQVNRDLFVTSGSSAQNAKNEYNNAVDELINLVIGAKPTDTAELQEWQNNYDLLKQNLAIFSDPALIVKFTMDHNIKISQSFEPIKQIAVLDCVFNIHGEPSWGWVDVNNPDENADAKVQWYTNLYNRMEKGYTVIEAGLASSNEWIEFALESGLVTMEQVDTDNNWTSTIYTNISDITEVTDEAAVAKAEAEYNKAMNNIENKDQRYDMELKNIDTEHNSLQTEYDSVKSVIDKNIERSFKIYS